MQDQSYQDRMKSIYQMLFEMATGNLSFRMGQMDGNEELDELTGVLNMLAVTMQNTIAKSGYITPYYSYQGLTQKTWVLDKDYNIINFNDNVPPFLGYTAKALVKMEFDKVIAKHSRAIWDNIKQEITKEKNYRNTVQLIFITGKKKVGPAFCTISKLLHSDDIIISSITTTLQDSIADTIGSATKPTARLNDAAIIQNVYDYILNNLEEPLPSVKVLSKMFGSNEFKLKDGFRHFFKTSIYQFYNEERLKKAHLLIQQTDFPLKEIAFMSGFNSYLNFYKAFKKKYHYTPSELNRNKELE